MSIGIYKIENLVNHKVYIGQSIHIEKRWQEHCRQSSNTIISQAIKKYGKENFSFQILEECKVNQLDEKEQYYITLFNSVVPNGYNVVDYVQGVRRIYNNYDKDIFLQIIADIKNSSETFQEIANKYNLDLSMIYYLNRGDYHTLEGETYPLRPVGKKFNSKKQLYFNSKKQLYYCIDCGKEISYGAKRCSVCASKAQQVCERPSREELKRMIRTMSFIEIGKIFNVSDNAIRKWCKKENLPFKKSEIKKYSDEEWLQI